MWKKKFSHSPAIQSGLTLSFLCDPFQGFDEMTECLFSHGFILPQQTPAVSPSYVPCSPPGPFLPCFLSLQILLLFILHLPPPPHPGHLSFLCICMWYHAVYPLTAHASSHKMGEGEIWSQVSKKEFGDGGGRMMDSQTKFWASLEPISNVWFISTWLRVRSQPRFAENECAKLISLFWNTVDWHFREP